MNPQPDTLHDRITGDDRRFLDLVREHHRVEVDLNDPHQGTYRSHVGGLLDIIDDLLAETTTAQPEADAVERAARAWSEYLAERVDAEARRTGARWTGPTAERVRKQERRRSFEAGYRAALAAAQPVEPEPRVCDGCTGEYPDGDPGVIHKHYGEHCACGWFGPSWQAHRPACPAQPVEPEPDEREARAWKDAWREYVGPNTMSDLAVRTHAHRAGFAAGFRRSRPEATHTEWTVRHPDGRPIPGAQILPDRTWIDDFALARWPGAIVVRREVSAWTTVADTPTQAGDDA